MRLETIRFEREFSEIVDENLKVNLIFNTFIYYLFIYIINNDI